MSLRVLRAALLVIGVVLLVGATALGHAGCGLGVTLRLALPGLLLIGAVLFERWRYKRLTGGRPGPEWVVTDERFIDPESGKLVTVYYRPSTGERRYVNRVRRASRLNPRRCYLPASLFNGDLPGHPRPVVIGAAHVIAARAHRNKIEVLLFAGLNHEFGVFPVKRIGVAHFDGAEKRGRGQLVQLMPAVDDVQPIGDAAAKFQMIRHKAMFDSYDDDKPGLHPIGTRGVLTRRGDPAERGAQHRRQDPLSHSLHAIRFPISGSSVSTERGWRNMIAQHSWRSA
jgi:hypothetical protein